MTSIAAAVLFSTIPLLEVGKLQDCRLGAGDADVRIYVRGWMHSSDVDVPVELGAVACSNDRVVTRATFPRGINVVRRDEVFGILMAFQWSGNLCVDPDEKEMSYRIFYELEGRKCSLGEVRFDRATHILELGQQEFSLATCAALPDDPCDPR